MTTSRYDAIADWYVEFTRDWPREPVAPLPPDIAGQGVLDLACGYGTTSRYLARAGAAVTAVDLSRSLLARAKEIGSRAAEPSHIRYVHGDATTTDWWDGDPFDGVVCNMALMDIDDLSGALATVFAVLAAGGWFSLSSCTRASLAARQTAGRGCPVGRRTAATRGKVCGTPTASACGAMPASTTGCCRPTSTRYWPLASTSKRSRNHRRTYPASWQCAAGHGRGPENDPRNQRVMVKQVA